MSLSLKKNLVKGFFWSFFGQAGYLIVALISNIILARLLTPFQFGQVGIVMFFILIGKVLTESGLSGALVRKKNIQDEDYSTVFIFNLIVSCLLFFIFLLSSNFISKFYADDALQNILIVTSIVLIINAFQLIHTTRLIVNLEFKKKSIYTFMAMLAASVIGIIMAFRGFGVWSVVAIQILNSLFLTIILWSFEARIAKLKFVWKSFKELYKFGVNTTISSILNTAFENIYQIVLGRYFAINQTGLFYQAKKLQEVPVGVVNSVTQGVVFSALSRVQDDFLEFNQIYRKIVTLFTVAVGFICVFVFFYAQNIIHILYGEEWIEAVFYMQVLMLSSFFFMQEMFNRIIFKVFNKTEKILYLEILKKIIQTITIVIGVLFHNIELLLYGFLFTSILSYFINFYYSRKVLGSSSQQEILIALKVFLAGAITVGINYFVVIILDLKGYYSFLLLPFLGILYFIAVRIFGVANLIQEIKIVTELIKK